MHQKEQILICPHCGNKTIQEIKYTATGKEEVVVGSESDHQTDFMESYYILVQCKTCLDVSLYWDWEASSDLGDLNAATCIYPSVKQFSSLPAVIHESYKEAKKVQHISPSAFVILVRRALEQVCKDQNASGLSLKQQLDDLAGRGIIPRTLSRMANVLRYFGNLGAHSVDSKIGPYETNTIDDFFIAVVEYVYVAPEKLNKLNKTLEEKKLKNK